MWTLATKMGLVLTILLTEQQINVFLAFDVCLS